MSFQKLESFIVRWFHILSVFIDECMNQTIQNFFLLPSNANSLLQLVWDFHCFPKPTLTLASIPLHFPIVLLGGTTLSPMVEPRAWEMRKGTGHKCTLSSRLDQSQEELRMCMRVGLCVQSLLCSNGQESLSLYYISGTMKMHQFISSSEQLCEVGTVNIPFVEEEMEAQEGKANCSDHTGG